MISAQTLGLGQGAVVMRPTQREPDRREIEQALSKTGGVVARAARELGLSRQALYRRMDRLGIRDPAPGPDRLQ
jgi:transcriptional regulator with GAF, ATPase, and Fis domain